MKIVRIFLCVVFYFMFSMVLHAYAPVPPEPESMPSCNFSATVNGQELFFLRMGDELELLPGDYDGELLIPAGIEHDGKILTVTSLGKGSLADPDIVKIIIPHTVRELNAPFGESYQESANVDSIRFVARPAHYRGGFLPAGIFPKLKAGRMEPGVGDTWLNDDFEIVATIPHHLFAVRNRNSGKIGVTTYDYPLISFEYEDFYGMYAEESEYPDYFDSFGFVVKKNGLWGMVDINNNVLLPFKYGSPQKMGSEKAIVKKMGRAFDKLYKYTLTAYEMNLRLHDAEISYLMWLAGYEGGNETVYMPETSASNAYVEGMEWMGGVYSGPVDMAGRPHGRGVFTETVASYEMLFEFLMFELIPYKTYKINRFNGLWVAGRLYGDCVMEQYDYEDISDSLEMDDAVPEFTISGFMIDDDVIGKARLEAGEDVYEGRISTYNGNEYYDGNERIKIREWNYGEGIGTVYYHNGDTFKGRMWGKVCGDLNGEGKYAYARRGYRDGTFKHGHFVSGKVLLYHYDGSVYEGEAEGSDAVRNGYGKLTYADGDYVEGTFKNDIFVSGYVSIGDSVDRYEGEVVNGVRNGYGKWRLGDVLYEGEFKDGYPDGKGKMTFATGDYEDGVFSDGDFVSGKVLITFEDGDRMECEFKNGELSGKGRYMFSNGDIIVGSFKDGRPHGDCIYYYASGGKEEVAYGEAEYLRVEGKTSIGKTVPYYSTSETYSVDTDWGSYEITGLPVWAEVTSKTDDSFTVRYDRNSTPGDRLGPFYVKAGGKSVRVYIVQEHDENAVSGEIERSWLAYGATRGYGFGMTTGMEVHVRFTVNNLVGKNCQICVFFEFSNGQKLMDGNRQYYAADGSVSVYSDFKPIYSSTLFENYNLYIPYGELHLAPGQHQLRYYIQIFDLTTGALVCSSDYEYFSLSIW